MSQVVCTLEIKTKATGGTREDRRHQIYPSELCSIAQCYQGFRKGCLHNEPPFFLNKIFWLSCFISSPSFSITGHHALAFGSVTSLPPRNRSTNGNDYFHLPPRSTPSTVSSTKKSFPGSSRSASLIFFIPRTFSPDSSLLYISLSFSSVTYTFVSTRELM